LFTLQAHIWAWPKILAHSPVVTMMPTHSQDKYRSKCAALQLSVESEHGACSRKLLAAHYSSVLTCNNLGYDVCPTARSAASQRLSGACDASQHAFGSVACMKMGSRRARSAERPPLHHNSWKGPEAGSESSNAVGMCTLLFLVRLSRQ
jgi:hypothetical protein